MATCENRGYGTQIAATLTDLAFASPEVSVVWAHTLPDAQASQRVLQKCGFNAFGLVDDPEDGRVLRFENRRPGLTNDAKCPSAGGLGTQGARPWARADRREASVGVKGAEAGAAATAHEGRAGCKERHHSATPRGQKRACPLPRAAAQPSAWEYA